MNRVEGTVQSIEENDIVTYIRVKSGEETISLIKSKAPEWLGVGDRVRCVFQEASVCVSRDCPGKVSIENRLKAKLCEVRSSDSLCELTFESGIGKVVSLITTRACEHLGLEKGCEATMLLRGVDINLEPILLPIDIDKYRKVLNETRA
jgi:molybdopterin-binding protein